MIVLESLGREALFPEVLSAQSEGGDGRDSLMPTNLPRQPGGEPSTDSGLLHATNPEDAQPPSPPSCPGQRGSEWAR